MPLPQQRLIQLDRPQHAAVAVIAIQDRGTRHADDRRVLAAVGTNRDELEPLQAVDAAVAARNCGWAEPRFAAAGTLSAELDLRIAHALDCNGRPSGITHLTYPESSWR